MAPFGMPLANCNHANYISNTCRIKVFYITNTVSVGYLNTFHAGIYFVRKQVVGQGRS
jgi:hypothetical protein